MPPKLESKGKQMSALDVEKLSQLLNPEFILNGLLEGVVGLKFEILNHKFPNLMHDLVSDIACSLPI